MFTLLTFPCLYRILSTWTRPQWGKHLRLLRAPQTTGHQNCGVFASVRRQGPGVCRGLRSEPTPMHLVWLVPYWRLVAQVKCYSQHPPNSIWNHLLVDTVDQVQHRGRQRQHCFRNSRPQWRHWCGHCLSRSPRRGGARGNEYAPLAMR